jgi:Uma2 family endonuclease
MRARIEGAPAEDYDPNMARALRAPAPRRFTREEYHRMGEAGLFANERVELLDGAVVAMSPHSTRHASAVARAVQALIVACGRTAHVRCQLPIVLDDSSEPEPDIAVCRPAADDFAASHPRPEDVMLVVEVAESSLAYDRGAKAAAYAASGIREYWIVDITTRTVEVLAEPASAYTRRDVRGEKDRLTVPGGATVAVTDLLPV